jgi:hypothetical protein
VSLEFKVNATKRTELVPGNVILNIDLAVSYAEFLSLTKELPQPLKCRFETPDGRSYEKPVGIAKGMGQMADARITMRNFADEIPPGTRVTIL